MISWALLEQSIAQPVERDAITSVWSPKMRQGVRGEGARGDVEDGGGELARRSCTCWGSSAGGPARR